MSATGSGSEGEVFGKLGSVTLHDLIQMLSMGRRTATLTLRRGHDIGKMFFRDGQILHAGAGPFEGEDGILELLQWQEADFRMEEGIDTLPKITIGKPVDAVLLGTLTRLDNLSQGTKAPVWRPGDPDDEVLDLDFDLEPAAPAPPPKPARRYPRRPSKGRTSTVKRSLWIATGLVGAAGLSTVSFLLVPNATAAIGPWIAEPWKELPEVQTQGAALAAEGPVPRDAWSTLVWTERLDAEEAATAPPEPRVVAAASRDLPSPTRASATADVAGPGFLTVVVEPWGRVSIDGRLIGETPLGKQELSAGEHRITLENDHVIGLIQDRLVVRPGETLVRRYSFQDLGFLQFVVEPWADVSVDGRSVGQTPLGRVRVPKGAHTVLFEHPRFGRHERSVEVSYGEATLVKLDWRELP